MNRITQLLLLLVLGVVSCQSSSNTTENISSTKISEEITTDLVENESVAVQSYKDVIGSMQIEGIFLKKNSLNGKYVRLYETEGKDIFEIDSAKVTNGKFNFDLKDIHVGLYRIGIYPDERSLGKLILNPNEKRLTINYLSGSFVKNVDVRNSKENDGLKDYKVYRDEFDKVVKTIRESKAQKEVKLQQLYDAQNKLNEQEDALSTKYPNTFVGNMLLHMQSPYKFDKEKFWDDLDFKDETLIHSRVYANRISDYMSKHAKKENTKQDPSLGYYNAVDLIAQKVKEGGSSKVLEFMLYTISEGMYSSGQTDVALYVVDNYFYGDACGDSDISELFKRKAAGIRNLQVGNEPPSFRMKSHTGAIIDSKKIISKNKYTLLFFWASYCHNCEAEIPVLKTTYATQHNKGFEIIGVSVDLQDRAWKNAITENELKWLNCAEMKGWKGDVTREYRVSRTPTMFLINEKNHLVLKTKSAAEVNRFLEKRLK